MAGFFQSVIADNNLFDGIYVEPYAGGASVALSLLFNEYVSKVVINDIDRSIYAFWHSVLNHTEKLCNLISKTDVNFKNWQKNKEIQRQKKTASLVELGFSTFFLNRTNISGIIKGGVIGGVQQKGKWKIDARFNKNNLIGRIQRIAEYSNRIELHNLDACKLLQKQAKRLPKKTIFYFDPPYYAKGKDLYINHYGPDDHKKVSSVIKKIKRHRWIVSYDNQSEIKMLYKVYRKMEYCLKYSVSKPSVGTEVMFFSHNLIIPTASIPAETAR